MAESNVELHRRIADLWNDGDWDAVFAYYDDDIVFEDRLLPDGDVVRGREQVIAHFEELRSIGGDWRFETESMRQSGDDVLWIGTTFGRLNEDTPPYEIRTGAVFTYVDGRCIRIRWFPTPEAAEEASG